MNILHLVYDDIGNPWIGGGGAYRMKEIYDRLSKWGHECTVLCGNYPGAKDREAGNLRYLYRGGTSSLGMSAIGYIMAAYSYVLRHGREYDVLVEDFSVFTPVFARLLTRRATVLQLQLYCDRKSFRRYGPLAPLLRASQNWYPRRYHHAIYLNEDLASRWKQNGQQRYYVRMGIPEHYLSSNSDAHSEINASKPSLSSGDGELTGGYILYLGRLMYEEKGLDVLRKACPLIWQRLPDMRILLAGAGRQEMKVRQEFADLERTYPGRITFTGLVGGNEKEAILSKCRALVLPSREEGEGLVVLEAAAFGKPIIASSIRELCYVGRNGIGMNIETGDSTALADAIIRLCTDEQLETDLSRQAQRWAAQHTWEHKAREFEHALETVVTNYASRGDTDRRTIPSNTPHDSTCRDTQPNGLEGSKEKATGTRTTSTVSKYLGGVWRYARRQVRLRRLAPHIWRQSKGRILGGPFQGMQYIPATCGSEWMPKILGTYEMELAPVLEETIARRYESLINIGAAEGYYAVGFATRSPTTQVTCFETTRRGRHLLETLAVQNNASNRIKVLGTCTPESLDAALGGNDRPLIICDVEGAERELLDPARIPRLASADILVELHDCICAGVGTTIRKRFSPSHNIAQIWTMERKTNDLPDGIHLPATYALESLSELRPGRMSWLWMTVSGKVNRG